MRLPAAPNAALLAVLLAACTTSSVVPLPAEETATLADGRRLAGRLEWSDGRLAFLAGDPPRRLDGADLKRVDFSPDGRAVSPAASGSNAAPQTIRLWGDEQLTGRVVALDDDAARIETDGETLTVPRAALSAVFGPERWVDALAEDFEQPTSDGTGAPWTLLLDVGRSFAGESSLRVAGECDVRRAIEPPLSDGEVALRFFDAAHRATGRQWLVELQFGRRPVRLVLGWDSGRIAVESPHGPSLVVRDIPRADGWRLLRVRFSPHGLSAEVDGAPLAEGASPREPLSALRIATRSSPAVAGAPRPAEDTAVAGWIDALRIAERVAGGACGRRDAEQDIVRLPGGDELFGTLTGYSPAEIVISGALGETRLAWAQIDAMYLRRRAPAGRAIEGPIVGAHWSVADRSAERRPSPRHDYLEGAVAGLTDERLLLDHPRLGRLALRREALVRLDVLYEGRRREIEAAFHHLGDELRPELEVIAPDGPRWELRFDVAALPVGAAWLALSVVGLEGQGSPFAPADENSPLRTDVVVNGRRLDYLNRHVLGTPVAGVRIRLPLPPDALRQGENRLAFEQAPSADDPTEYDDFGLWGVAIEEDGR